MIAIKPIDYPQEPCEGKFVQLYAILNSQTNPIPLFRWRRIGTEDCKHGFILRELLEELGLKPQEADTPYLRMLRFPARRGENYDAPGMGVFEFKEGVFIFRKPSADYQIRASQEHLEHLRQLDPNFRYDLKDRSQL